MSTGSAVWSMTATEKQQALLDLTALQAQVESLRLELLVEAERAGDCTAEGDRTAADWLARQTQQRRARTRADLTIAGIAFACVTFLGCLVVVSWLRKPGRGR